MYSLIHFYLFIIYNFSPAWNIALDADMVLKKKINSYTVPVKTLTSGGYQGWNRMIG